MSGSDTSRRADDRPVNKMLRWLPLLAALITIVTLSVKVGQATEAMGNLGDRVDKIDATLGAVLKRDLVTRAQVAAIVHDKCPYAKDRTFIINKLGEHDAQFGNTRP